VSARHLCALQLATIVKKTTPQHCLQLPYFTIIPSYADTAKCKLSSFKLSSSYLQAINRLFHAYVTRCSTTHDSCGSAAYHPTPSPTAKVRERSAEGYLGRPIGSCVRMHVHAHPAILVRCRLLAVHNQTGRKSPGSGAESASPSRQDPTAQVAPVGLPVGSSP